MNGFTNGRNQNGKKTIYSKKDYLFSFVIGFLTICAVFAYTNAQQENNNGTISEAIESELNGISLEKEMRDGEQKQIIESNYKLSKIGNGEKPNGNGQNRQITEPKETGGMSETQSQVGELVIVKGFAKDSFATNVNTWARNISKDKKFLIMLKCENGDYDMYLQSGVPANGPNGREDSRGLCQLHRTRHSEVVDNPLFWNDWKRQVEKCYEKRNGGTTFYGPNRPIYRNKKYIGLCKDVVANDFTFVSK